MHLVKIGILIRITVQKNLNIYSSTVQVILLVFIWIFDVKVIQK